MTEIWSPNHDSTRIQLNLQECKIRWFETHQSCRDIEASFSDDLPTASGRIIEVSEEAELAKI